MSEVVAEQISRVGVVCSAFGEDVRAAAHAARSIGFSGVQLDPRMGELDLVSLSQSGRRELMSVLRGNGLELVSLRFDLGAKGLGSAADIDSAIDRVEKVLVAAAGLQCRLVCVDLGPPPVDMAMEELARRADRHGVAVAFRSDLCGFAELERAVKTGDCPWFLIDLDPVAVLRDGWDADEIFSRVGQKIGHVRGRDAILGAEKRTKAAVMGKGSIEWIEMLARLDAAGYHGWISVDPVELPNRAGAARVGAELLRMRRV
jgi:sugar phosphate isomerase/epimerase